MFCGQFIEYTRGHVSDLPRQDQKPVLIANVEGVNSAKYSIPCRARIERADRVSDLFAGELYLSAANGSFQSVVSVPPRERKLELVRARGSFVGKCIEDQIERCSQVVNGIPNDQGELWWDGLLCFDEELHFAGLAAMTDRKLEGLLSQKGINSTAKIVDVMLGPL
jgi:hypothetical protein